MNKELSSNGSQKIFAVAFGYHVSSGESDRYGETLREKARSLVWLKKWLPMALCATSSGDGERMYLACFARCARASERALGVGSKICRSRAYDNCDYVRALGQRARALGVHNHQLSDDHSFDGECVSSFAGAREIVATVNEERANTASSSFTKKSSFGTV